MSCSKPKRDHRAIPTCPVRESALIPFTFARARPVALAALILWLAIPAPGQVHGRVHGLVQDANGSPVAGARVVAHSTRENTDHAFVSAADGSFTMDELKPGHYQFQAMKRGFADSAVTEADLRRRESDPESQAPHQRRISEKTFSSVC